MRPNVYDPPTRPELFAGVVGRRSIAFVIDVAIVLCVWIVVYAFLAIAGFFTFFLTWLLLPVAFPAIALGYNAYTLSGPHSATIGMRMVELEMRTWYGEPMYALLGAFHALLFYVSVTMLTPFVLLLAFFNPRKRCLHDFFSGCVIVNAPSRVAIRA